MKGKKQQKRRSPGWPSRATPGGADRPRTSKTSRRTIVIAFNKPYGVLSQFTTDSGRPSLEAFGPFPRDVYPAGRLDAESEGLLLLTNSNELKHRLTHPRFSHTKTYLVQIERQPSPEALESLRTGVMVLGIVTRPASVRLLEYDPLLPPRPSPVRIRKNVPTVWIEITLHEGRNRQVRRMTAAVGHPTLRLVRTAIGGFRLGSLKPGHSKVLSEEEITTLTIRQ